MHPGMRICILFNKYQPNFLQDGPKKPAGRPSGAGRKKVEATAAASPRSPKGKTENRGRKKKQPAQEAPAPGSKSSHKKKVVTSTAAAASKARKRAIANKPSRPPPKPVATPTGRRAAAKAGSTSTTPTTKVKIGLKVKPKSARESLRQKQLNKKPVNDKQTPTKNVEKDEKTEEITPPEPARSSRRRRLIHNIVYCNSRRHVNAPLNL